MDRSVDSIGSCSLDVDADSSDVSDTSGSLNFATPISAKDITREFTSKITERCQFSQNTTTYLDPVSGQIHTIVTAADSTDTPEKKPSYLNLACCVNGYSNLTTYDSKVRQDINKSREVSPIRPSTNSLQFCKKTNALAPPIFISVNKSFKNNQTNMSSNQYFNNSIGSNDTVNIVEVVEPQQPVQPSFIQQRVERLYGPGALAQVFYSPKKIKSKSPKTNASNDNCSNVQSEFCRKYQQFSTNRYLSQCKKNSNDSPNENANNILSADVTDHSVNNIIDLPVLRHLSQEFRAQLPTISPKRTYVKHENVFLKEDAKTDLNNHDNEICNKKPPETVNESIQNYHKTSTDASEESLISVVEENIKVPLDTSLNVKDGNYFLEILRQEQNRLLELAHQAEKYLSSLTNNEDISEEVLGLLRSASGKARLLVSQKMKQFEGLCHNNLNRSPEDAFPTTIEDLQGFWDMVYLQVEHIDTIFKEIEELKRNDWKMTSTEIENNSTITNKAQKSGLSKAGKPKGSTVLANGGNHQKGTNGTAVKSAAALKREAQRKQLMELKRKNKMAMNTENTQINPASAIEIFVSDNNS